MTEFNPNCGKCGMLNSRGFCSLTACRYPSNAIVVESKVIRGMMVNPQIKEIPAADVVPVRHGRWVKTIGENGVTSACRCNLCGFEDNRFSLFNYCPNCGAKMDGEA